MDVLADNGPSQSLSYDVYSTTDILRMENTESPPSKLLPVVVVGGLIASVVIGAYFLRDCPVQPYIPVYLIVFGVFVSLALVVSKLCLVCGLYAKDAYEMLTWSILVIPLGFVLYLFAVCWFITGSVWIYSIYPPSYDPTNGQKYCNKTLYLFAFWLNTLCYGCLAFILLCIVCSAFYTCVKTTFQRPHPLASSPPQQV